ncbi:hypothetical protein BH23GEM3_BH23GEM3_21720 [soil metagenome]|jgi:uncharacterized membrane protein SirB2|nr:hypothetical protein [Gemmatimonadota bacterium]
MIPYITYRFIHFVGIFLVLVSLGGVALHAANQGTKQSSRTRKLTAITHGIGMFVVLLGGFGLLARLGIAHGTDWPGWVWTKLGIWVVLGVVVILPYRRPELARPLFLTVPLLAVLAAYMAIFKPF